MLEQAGLSNYTFPRATSTDSLSSDSTSGPTDFVANGPSHELSKALLSVGVLPCLWQG